MNFVGLPQSTLLSIAAAAALATLVLYILKLRRRAVAVPFAKIWQRVVKDQDATSLFSQLKRLFSLLLQLALLALLIAALGDPRLAKNTLNGRSVVVLIDASASMKAVDVAPSRAEVAKGKIREVVRGLSGADRVLLAQMDAAVTPLSTMTGDIAELTDALEHLKVSDARADFPRALRFATDTLRGQKHPEIIVVSDGNLGAAHDSLGDVHLGKISLSYIPVGKEGKNVGITQFSVRRYPLDKSRYEVMLEVSNTNETPADVELSLYGDGELVDVTKLHLGPKERLPRFYPNLSGASRTLEARIQNADGTHDHLPADDRAYALLPERRRVRVQAVTPGNTYLEAALLLDEYLDVTTVKPANYPAKGSFDVTIFDGVTPVYKDGSGGAIYLDVQGKNSPVKLAKKGLKDFGFDDWDKKSPILRWMVVDTIGVAKGHELIAGEKDKIVAVTISKRRRKKRAFAVEGKRDGHRFLALGFDPRNSDIVLRIAWPLLLINTINHFVAEDAEYLSSYRTGQIWHVPSPEEALAVRLTTPDTAVHHLPVQEGRAVVLGQQAGFYKVKSAEKDASIETMFAANMSDIRESGIIPTAKLLVDGKQAGPVSGFKVGVRRQIWVYLLLAALALTALEWFTYHRRLTV